MNRQTSKDRLLPFIALTLSVGCGTNGDFIPYSELPAVQMEGIPNTSSPASPAPEASTKTTTNTPPVTSSTDASQQATAPAASSDSAAKESDSAKAVAAPVGVVPVSKESALPTADATATEAGDMAAKTPDVKTVVSSQTGLEGPADVPQIENTAGEVREIKLLIPEKRFLKERGTTALRVSYDDIDLLKVLNMEPVPSNAADHFPGWLQELNGKSVRVRGFMYPTFEATGLTEFTMARDNGICCFVRKPKIYDIIGVTLAEGVTTDYIEGRPFDVEGTFHIEPEGDEHGLYRLYRISNARVVR